MRAKAQHDEAQALWNTKKKKAKEIAKNALKMKLPIDDIVELSGLSKSVCLSKSKIMPFIPRDNGIKINRCREVEYLLWSKNIGMAAVLIHF